MTEIIFTTIHGSHLYGMAGPNSDMDTYVVTNSNARAKQKVFGGEDSVRIGWKHFVEYAFSGSHQSLEAMFSPRKVWNPDFKWLATYTNSFYATGPDVISKYERTIKSFAHADDFKRRRHACRLWLNLQDLRKYGRFNPVMTPEQIAWATEVATSDIGRDDLYRLLCEGDSSFGNFLWEN
jgi:hypothetical protein